MTGGASYLDRTESGSIACGRLVGREAKRVGTLLDGTHIGERSSLEMIGASDDLVVLNHASPATLFPNTPRLDPRVRARWRPR